jgi:hypothetical protein
MYRKDIIKKAIEKTTHAIHLKILKGYRGQRKRTTSVPRETDRLAHQETQLTEEQPKLPSNRKKCLHTTEIIM